MSRALIRGLRVIENLSEADEGGLGPSAVAERVGIDKATASRILKSLIEEGYAVQNELTRRYRLTSKLMRVAQHSTPLGLREIALPHLRRLSEDFGETVHLGVLEDLQVVYLDKIESTNSIQLVSAVGQTMPLHSTSLGKAMLARSSRDEIDAVIDRLTFEPRTKWTITDPDLFRQEIERTRTRGYATDDRENEDAGACVAAAVVGPDGHVLGAISISGPEFRIRDHFTAFGEAARSAAAAISAELGVDSS